MTWWTLKKLQALVLWADTQLLLLAHLQSALLRPCIQLSPLNARMLISNNSHQGYKSAAQRIRAGSQEAPLQLFLRREASPQQSLKRLKGSLEGEEACHQPSNPSCEFMSHLVH